MKWVKLKKYCENTGDTTNTVHYTRLRGIWLDGLHSIARWDRMVIYELICWRLKNEWGNGTLPGVYYA